MFDRDIFAEKRSEALEIIKKKPTLSHNLTNFISIILVIICFGLILWYGYKLHSKPTELSELPLIKADHAPTKVKPADPGGMIIPNTDKTIYENMGTNGSNKDNLPKVAKILSNPEEPIDRDSILSEEKPEVSEVVEAEAPVPVELNAVKEVVVEKPLKKEEKLKIITKETTNKLKTPNKQILKNKYKVQLASFKSNMEAESEWQKIKKRNAKLLSKYQYQIEKKELVSKGTFYRLQIGPFANNAAAHNLCKALIAAGQSCLVVKP